ncbi:MAG: hypothetical protein ABR928_12345 [Terracidiphilus sp.]|jgi:hypothetical protein
MITIHLETLLLVPAAVAVCFMLWFLVMLWKEEHRGHAASRKPERLIHLQHSTGATGTMSPMHYSGLK